MAPSVRTRLTLWYATALTVTLVAYGGGVYALLRQVLYANLDAALRHDIEETEEELPELLAEPNSAAGDAERWRLEVWRDGKTLVRSWPSGTADLAPPAEGCLGARTTLTGATSPGGLELRSACRLVRDSSGAYVLRAFRSAEKLSADLARLATLMLIGLPLAVILAAVAGYFLARRLLRPIQDMARQAQRISATHLGERLSIANRDDELGELATSFNGMFARLEAGFEQMRRFTADASHELRTPLTAIRTSGEVALKNGANLKQMRDVVASMLEETDHLRQLIDSLLTLSRADAGQLQLKREAFDLRQLVRDVVTHLEVLAEEKAQVVHVHASEAITFAGDSAVLRRALINLVDNAIKYSPEHTAIDVTVKCDQLVTIEVRDQGPGIPAPDQPRIFDRFYRINAARDRQQGGTGLGLAIACWAVEAHGGHIVVHSDGVRGSSFVIELQIS